MTEKDFLFRKKGKKGGRKTLRVGIRIPHHINLKGIEPPLLLVSRRGI
jgi:hypothetical protein